MKGVLGSITLVEDAKPKCQTSRRMPLAYEAMVKCKLEGLLERGIIEAVNYSSGWVNPLLVVPKRDKGEIRMCLDLRYVNQFIVDQPCMLPSLDQLSVFAEGAVVFSIIDLPDAFHLIELDEKVRCLTTFSTIWGLYRYLRLCFGLKNAPAVFMKVITHVLKELLGVLLCMDDLLVVGRSIKDHDEKLSQVLKRLDMFNIPVNVQKCKLRLAELDTNGRSESQAEERTDLERLESTNQHAGEVVEPDVQEEGLSEHEIDA